MHLFTFYGEAMKHLDIPESYNKILLQFLNIDNLIVYANSSDLYTEITLRSKKEYYPYTHITKINNDHFLHIDFSKIFEDLEIIIELEGTIILNILDYISDEVVLTLNTLECVLDEAVITFAPISNNVDKTIVTVSKINSSKSIKIN